MDLPDGNYASVSAHEQVLTVTAEEHGLETRLDREELLRLRTNKTEKNNTHTHARTREVVQPGTICKLKVDLQRDVCEPGSAPESLRVSGR